MSIFKPFYIVKFSNAASKYIDKLNPKISSQIFSKLEELATGSKNLNIIKLAGFRNLYRLRSGKYRIIYQIREKHLIIYVVAVGDRKNIYNVLKNLLKNTSLL
jgi:mRNA interferase RelE/StbE